MGIRQNLMQCPLGSKGGFQFAPPCLDQCDKRIKMAQLGEVDSMEFLLRHPEVEPVIDRLIGPGNGKNFRHGGVCGQQGQRKRHLPASFDRTPPQCKRPDLNRGRRIWGGALALAGVGDFVRAAVSLETRRLKPALRWEMRRRDLIVPLLDGNGRGDNKVAAP